MFDGSGWWVIFPFVMVIFMVLMMSRMLFFRHGSRPGTGSMRMGHMGGLGGEHQTTDDSALEVLRRRYAAGELSDEQFDAMRRKLQED